MATMIDQARHGWKAMAAVLLACFILPTATAGEPVGSVPRPADGTLVFAGLSGSTWDIWHRQGGHLSQLTQNQHATSPAVAADGRIAFADATGAIRILTPAGNLLDLTDAPVPCNHPAWSPDGRKLVFACFRFSNRQDDGALWLADLTDGGVTLLYDGPGLQKSPAWSPGGHTLAFVSGFRLTSSRVVETIWTLDIRTGQADRFVDADTAAVQPAWSPDGRQLAYAVDQGGNMDIWRRDRAGGPGVQLTDHPAYDGQPVWSPDGTEIAFVSTRGGELEIWRIPVQGGEPRRWIGAGEGGPASLKDPAWGPGVAGP